MRLAQIARKVGLTPTEIKRFLEAEFDLNIGKEPNYKLEEAQINAVLEKFPIPVIEKETKDVSSKNDKVVTSNITNDASEETETVREEPEETPAKEEVTIVEEEAATETVAEVAEEITTEEPEAEIEIELVEQEAVNVSEAKEIEINYDDPTQEGEEGEFTEAAVDPDAELVKVPSVKLDGLKVLGKIELPEKKVIVPEVSEEEVEQKEADAIALLDAAMQSQVQDVKTGVISQPVAEAVKANIADQEEAYSEYKDKRGIYHFSAQQKANRVKALARIEQRKKVEAEKQKKKRHYEELMKAKQDKTSGKTNKETVNKAKKTAVTKKKKEIKNAPKPKGLWARFVHWLND